MLIMMTSKLLNWVFLVMLFSHQSNSMHILKRFLDLDIRIGQVTNAVKNTKARAPSLKLQVDFGPDFEDLEQSSAQLTEVYPEGNGLLEQQIAAVTNFPKRHVGIPSYFLTLGVIPIDDEPLGTVVIKPLREVPNASKVKLLNDDPVFMESPRQEKVNYEDTFHQLEIRVGTIQSTGEKTIDFGELGIFFYHGNYVHFNDGLQILRLRSIEGLVFTEDNFLGIVGEDNDLIPITPERLVANGRILK